MQSTVSSVQTYLLPWNYTTECLYIGVTVLITKIVWRHTTQTIKRCPFVLSRVAGVNLEKKHFAVLTLLSVLWKYRSCGIYEENSKLKECFQRHITWKLLSCYLNQIILEYFICFQWPLTPRTKSFICNKRGRKKIYNFIKPWEGECVSSPSNSEESYGSLNFLSKKRTRKRVLKENNWRRRMVSIWEKREYMNSN